MDANVSHIHSIHAQSPASGFGVQALSASNAPGTGWYNSEIGSTNIDHGHQYYLPSHRHWIKARATTAGSSHNHVFSGTSAAGSSHNHVISGATDNGGFANTALNNEPAYVEVVWVIRVK